MQSAAADLAGRRRQAWCRERDVAADEVHQSLRRALVGNVLDLDVELLRERLREQMAVAADAGGGIGERLLALARSDELVERLDVALGVHRQRDRRATDRGAV